MNTGTIRTEDLIRLPIGSKTTLPCKDGKHCESVVSIAYRIPRRLKEYADRRYKCRINWLSSEVTIEVLKVDASKSKKK